MTSSRRTASRARTSKTTRATARKRAADASADAMRDAVRRVLAPLDAVVISRDRLQEVLDDAVERGRMTRDDAGDLLTELLSRGRRQTEDLLGELEHVVALPTERVLREVDRARRASGLGPAFPIAAYDDMTAAEVTEHLGELTPGELRRVRDYERRNANRKSVLAAVERKLR
jgi:polyhydroxyalkanoate synthesis regulator phasin